MSVHNLTVILLVLAGISFFFAFIRANVPCDLTALGLLLWALAAIIGLLK